MTRKTNENTLLRKPKWKNDKMKMQLISFFHLRGIMPEYRKYDDYKGYSVKTKPVGIRRLFPILPYFVGSKIKLRIQFQAVSNEAGKDPLKDFVLFEIHPQKSRMFKHSGQSIFEENYNWNISSDILTQQGDFEIYMGYGDNYDPHAPLFFASILHKDRLRYEAFLVLLGAVLGVVLAWLLGFIEIIPFWKIWITP